MEAAADCSILMVHLSRICEEIILWCTWEFRFAELDDAFSTGSSNHAPEEEPGCMQSSSAARAGRVYGEPDGAAEHVMKGLSPSPITKICRRIKKRSSMCSIP